MNRRSFQLLASALLSSTCLLPACQEAKSPQSAAWLKNPARRADKELVAVFAPALARSETLVRTLRSELALDFDVFAFGVERGASRHSIDSLVRSQEPTAIVLIDNPTVTAYSEWAKTQLNPPPAIILMSSFAEDLHRQVPNSTGIAFEPPAVRSLTDARYILGVPIHRVGVVYRKGFESYFAREKARAALEKIQLIGMPVRHSPSAREVHRALVRLSEADVHALWVPNDNALLSNHLLQDGWVPVLERHRIPVIVGVPSLISHDLHFGTFAAVPDVEAIGVQAADLIYKLSSHAWKTGSQAVLPPLSIRTYVDVERARHLGMTPETERGVDVLVGSQRHRGQSP